MSVRAGSIVTVAGRNVVDRLQSAGLGDARLPIETVREIGNDLVVDKVPGEPDYTYSMESWDTSTDIMAFLHGKVGNQAANQPPGYLDPVGTEYRWEDCQFVNITSPWKSNTGAAGGNINAGLIIPGYYPTRLRYRFGATENAVQEVELAGGSYYYAETPPVEEYATADGVASAFVSSEAARAHRIGGATGTSFRYVFGVLLDGQLQVEGVDYTVAVTNGVGDPSVATINFAAAPANTAEVRFCYFTEVAKALPQAVNADAIIKPGAVRGRNIVVLVGERGSNEIQTLTVAATGGSYKLSFNGAQTAALPFGSVAAVIQAALEGLPTIGTGNVVVTGAGPFVITFVGALGGENQPPIVVDAALATGGAVTMAQTTAGGVGDNRVRFSGVQTFELEATVDGEVEREMGNDQPTGRVVNGTDVTGTVTVRPKDKDAFFQALSLVTGVARDEVFGYYNLESSPVEIQIRNPKNPAQVLKTIFVEDGQFQPPPTPARVNAAVDFPFQFNSVNGTFSEFKGGRP